MKAKKQVRSRLKFTPGYKHNGYEVLDVVDTFNMTERNYLDRDIDMRVEDEDGVKHRIKKEFIASVHEIKVVRQEAVEVVADQVSEEVL